MALPVHNGPLVPHNLRSPSCFWRSPHPLFAQTGSISGTIVDARDGTPLEKVSVRVHDTPLAHRHRQLTDAFSSTTFPPAAANCTSRPSTTSSSAASSTCLPATCSSSPSRSPRAPGTYSETVNVTQRRGRGHGAARSRCCAATSCSSFAASSRTIRCAPSMCCPASPPATTCAASSACAACRCAT